MELHDESFDHVENLTMKKKAPRPTRLPILLFTFIFLALSAYWGCRLWSVRALLLDAHVRTETNDAFRALVAAKGWLLSDLDLQRVDALGFRVVHRVHLRGTDPSTCLDGTFSPPSLAPCASPKK